MPSEKNISPIVIWLFSGLFLYILQIGYAEEETELRKVNGLTWSCTASEWQDQKSASGFLALCTKITEIKGQQKSSHCLFLQIKFYWLIVTPALLHISVALFMLQQHSWVVVPETIWASKSESLLVPNIDHTWIQKSKHNRFQDIHREELCDHMESLPL